MKGQKKKQESRHWHSAVKADAEVLLTGAPPVAWMQLYRPRGVLLQSEHTWAHSHSYESYLRVLSGNTRSRLERDWQFLCCKPDAAGDSTNERKSWRDLCLMPQRHFLPPHPPLRGKIQGLWLSRLLKSYVMLAFFFFLRNLTFMMHSVALFSAFWFWSLTLQHLQAALQHIRVLSNHFMKNGVVWHRQNGLTQNDDATGNLGFTERGF